VLSKAEPTSFPADHAIFGAPGDVSPWDIRFDPTDRAYFDGEGEGVVRIRVWSEPDLVDAHLVVRTPTGATGYPMEAVATSVRFTFWEVVAGPLEDGAEYTLAFRSRSSGTGVYLAPSGVTNVVERLDRWPLALAEPLSVPDWAQGMVVYQIFPDRFDSTGQGTPDGLEAWGSEPTRTGFQGGDLAGVTRHLDYLSDLGVDAIYLNPIFASPSNHRYDATDYYNVDPMLGGNQALTELVEKSHAAGLRVILDASFNHVHPRFFAFQDVVRRGPRSEYWDWFVVDEWPIRVGYRQAMLTPALVAQIEEWSAELGIRTEQLDGDGRPTEPSYDAWYGVATMPRVNLATPEARAYMLDVAVHWITEYDVDGWRMDVARYVDPDFWADLRVAVRTARPDVYLLSEVMGDASDWLQGDKFDATMNYTFRDLSLRFFARDEIDGPVFLDESARLWAQHAWAVTLANHNLLGSHDTARLLTECRGEVWRAVLAAVFQMTFPGAPGIYYGDEVGMEGEDDPGCRGPMDWARNRETHPIFTTYQGLARLRRSEPALVTGDWRPILGMGDLVAYSRELEGRRVLVAINRGPEQVDLVETAYREVLWGEALIGEKTVTLGPRSAAVLA
jgi:cyclomaltodextrinase